MNKDGTHHSGIHTLLLHVTLVVVCGTSVSCGSAREKTAGDTVEQDCDRIQLVGEKAYVDDTDYNLAQCFNTRSDALTEACLVLLGTHECPDFHAFVDGLDWFADGSGAQDLYRCLNSAGKAEYDLARWRGASAVLNEFDFDPQSGELLKAISRSDLPRTGEPYCCEGSMAYASYWIPAGVEFENCATKVVYTEADFP